MAQEDFVNFYKPILKFSDAEWSIFINTLSMKLPLTLRITPSKLKNKIKSILSLQKNLFFEDVYSTVYGEPQDRDFIINQTNVGFIQRQEIVSMLPVLLMNLKPHHSVIDMCAAPGSKTKQLLECSKLVIANDCNAKRLNVLVTETCKIPHKSYMVLKHDASILPVFKNDFDRVLCDVPCSGDGTARKNPLILNNWKLSKAIGLSNLQLKILKHSFKFVKSDGLVVYSTCSLNPIENEWIIQQVVISEDLEIVDLRQYLNNDFIVREGITFWEYSITKNYTNDLTTNNSNKNAISYRIDNDDLRKCIRIYPHDNNTGGFFITGLKKKNKINIAPKHTKGCVYKEIDSEIKIKLEKEYNLADKLIVHKKGTNNTLYNVSQEIYDIMVNNKLNVIYCGYKIFEKCTLNSSGYRMKNLGDSKWDVEVRGRDCIKNKMVRMKLRKGSCLVKLGDFDIIVGGFSYGDKINLYISNNLQKALLYFINN